MDIKNLIQECHTLAKDKGWWDNHRDIPELLCLIHSEISEALEEYRNNLNIYNISTNFLTRKPEGFPIEIADTIIRILDLCGYYGIELEEAIKIKMEYNRKRPYRHGGKIA